MAIVKNLPGAPGGQAAMRGVSWLLAQTLGTKLVNTALQVALGWWLLQKDFGLIGLAYTVTSFISILQQAGLREVLIHRQSSFRIWANAAFWMSLVYGIGGMILTLLAIPIATHVYRAPGLGGVLALLAVNALFNSLMTVPAAELTTQMRFKALSAITVFAASVQAGIACVLASPWFAFGAYSVILASVVGVLCQLVLLWSVARYRPKFSFHFKRWRYMIGDSGLILLNSILITVMSQGDYIALGLFHPPEVTGVYYFAYNLSMQTITLLTLNVANVLFPALSKFRDEPARQVEGFINAARLLAIVAIPTCLLQAVLTAPIMHLIFRDRWNAAIPVMQILCLGMALWAVGIPAVALMQSQGRFRALVKVTGACTLVYAVAVLTAAARGGTISVAATESVLFALMGPIYIYVAAHRNAASRKSTTQIFVPALLASLLALAPGAAISRILSPTLSADVGRVLLILATAPFLYVLIIRLLLPEVAADLIARVRAQWSKIMPVS